MRVLLDRKVLFENNFIIDERFIVTAFQKSPQVFYKAANQNKYFAAKTESFETKYGPLEEVPVANLLGVLPLERMEQIIEKGQITQLKILLQEGL